MKPAKYSRASRAYAASLLCGAALFSGTGVHAAPSYTTTYSYDALGRLTRVVVPDAYTVEYGYDAAGNRLHETTSGISDRDGDGVPDGIDVCRNTSDPAQADFDNDGIGDVCDPDDDNDGVRDIDDAFPKNPNEQGDADGDGVGDKADTDDDNDGRADAIDNCPIVSNPSQADSDGDGAGDACDVDGDFCWDCLPSPRGWRSTLTDQ